LRIVFWKTAALIAASSILSLFIGACGGGAGDSASSSEPQTIEISTRWASANANDLPTLIAASDAVFVGRVGRLVEVREETLIPGTGSSPVPGKPGRGETTVPVSVFEVTVGRSARGGLVRGSTVSFEQAGGLTYRNGSPVRFELEGDEPLQPGGEYLFFAVYKPNGSLSAPPYARLQVTAEGLLPQEPWARLGALQLLSGLSAGEATGLVERGE